MLAKILIGSAGLVAVASAQSAVLSFTNVPNPITDGQAQAITYQTNDTTTPVTIILRKGVSTDLTTLYNLTTTATNGQYVWTPRTDLPNDNDYALEILQGNETNYFGPFRVQGYLGPLPASSSSSSASSGSITSSVTSSQTAIGTIGSGAGTGSALPQNTTFSSATLSASSSLSTTSAPATNSASTTSGASSSLKTSTAAASASSTGAANANFQVGSSLALVGAIAAMLFS